MKWKLFKWEFEDCFSFTCCYYVHTPNFFRLIISWFYSIADSIWGVLITSFCHYMSLTFTISHYWSLLVTITPNQSQIVTVVYLSSLSVTNWSDNSKLVTHKDTKLFFCLFFLLLHFSSMLWNKWSWPNCMHFSLLGTRYFIYNTLSNIGNK